MPCDESLSLFLSLSLHVDRAWLPYALQCGSKSKRKSQPQDERRRHALSLASILEGWKRDGSEPAPGAGMAFAAGLLARLLAWPRQSELRLSPACWARAGTVVVASQCQVDFTFTRFLPPRSFRHLRLATSGQPAAASLRSRRPCHCSSHDPLLAASPVAPPDRPFERRSFEHGRLRLPLAIVSPSQLEDRRVARP
jgi:hypothetical protein